MNVSNFILTKETKEKMAKPMSNVKKGKLRAKKLQELADSGKLQFIKTRGDLAEAVGFTYDQRNKAGYQWIKYKVDKGELQERLTGYTDDGRAEYEYIYSTTPVAKKPAATPVLPKKQASDDSTVITITHKDTTITLEDVSVDVAIEIIKMITEA